MSASRRFSLAYLSACHCTAAEAIRVAGQTEPVFVDEVAALPEAIAGFARDGDVVIVMGAGSIGAVPQKVVDLLQGALA